MFVSAKGIILRQVKATGGRRMILLFTNKYGKISAGSNLNEKGKNKAALAMRPFTYGNYELYKNKEYFNINSAQVEKSFFRIGEDVDKFMEASFILELTEHMLPEGLPQPALFNLLMEFLTAIEGRKSSFETLVLAYEIKALRILGTFPQLRQCTKCGKKENLAYFSIKDGGVVCSDCASKMEVSEKDSLISDGKFGIVNILDYFVRKPMSSFEKIGLNQSVARELQTIVRDYMSFYLDIGNLKSESFFEGNIRR